MVHVVNISVTAADPTLGAASPGSAAVRRVYDAVILYDGRPCTRHVVTNLVIEPCDADRAETRSYFTVFQALPDFPLQPIIAGRYHDEFRKIDGVWCFTRRHMITDLVGDLSEHLLLSLG